MSKNIIKINESDLHKIINDTVCKFINEIDRHREGYWKERWAEQKAAKQNGESSTTQKKIFIAEKR